MLALQRCTMEMQIQANQYSFEHHNKNLHVFRHGWQGRSGFSQQLQSMGIVLGAYVLALLGLALGQVESFGLLTVTHSRNGDYSVLEKYFKLYTQTECYRDFISEINIVWNNEDNPEDTPIFKTKPLWKIPVYFFRTTFNSMDHRYHLPAQSTAQLLYSLDDDIIVDCDTFRDTLARYNQAALQHLGPVTTNEVRGYGYDPSTERAEFIYQGHATALYYSIAEPGAAFVPRHFLQLYYLKLQELLHMRKIVLDVKNCDDIFFWATVQHFYPQIPGIYVKAQKNYKNTDPKVGQSKVKDVYTTRSNCINNISNALGYNSLRLFSKNSTKYTQNWQYPNLQIILNQKTAGLASIPSMPPEEKKTGQTELTLIQPQTISDLKGNTDPQEKETSTQTQSQPPQPTPIQTSQTVPASTNDQQLKPAQPQQNEETKQTAGSNGQQPIRSQTRTDGKIDELGGEGGGRESQLGVGEEKRGWRWPFLGKVGVLSAGVGVLMTILYKVYRRHSQLSHLYEQRVSDVEEEQQMYSSSIRLPDHY